MMIMESLTMRFSASPPPQNPSICRKSIPKTQVFLPKHSFMCSSTSHLWNSLQFRCSPSTVDTQIQIQQLNNISKTQLLLSKLFRKCISDLGSRQFIFKPQFSLFFLGFSFPHYCFAAETEEVSNKINLESILISIDNFFTEYPFFVPTVVFIWLVLIPLTEQYLQKYKFISALNAFRKLQEDASSQLLDIRDSKSLSYLGSPNLKILNKTVLQIEFREGDEVGFVNNVLKSFEEPANSTVCIIDNFDGNSMKVAELLVKNGFKEAYAIRGGIRGKKGWQEIQETLLPSSVHIKKRSKTSEFNTNGGIQQQDTSSNGNSLSSNTSSSSNNANKVIDTKDFSTSSPSVQSIGRAKTSSPYPNYPDLKPPSSPTPSKPN